MKISHFIRGRGAVLALLGGVALGSVACDTVDDLMTVKDPERIKQEDLETKKLADMLVNSAIGDFQVAYADPFIWVGEMLTDEVVTGINWEDYARVNERQVRYDEGPADVMFSDLSGARYTAELMHQTLVDMNAPEVTNDMLATTLAYEGYAYILLGDAMCQATVDEGSDLYTPEQMYGFAIERLTQVLNMADDPDLQDLARVGLARAHLDRLEYSDAMTFADAVTPGFEYWVDYNSDTRASNPLYDNVRGANHNMGVHPRFLNGGWADWKQPVADSLQSDPRIQHSSTWSTGHNGFTPLYKPYQSWSYSGYTGNTIADGAAQADPAGVDLYERDSDIRFASKLEAQHMYYEAMMWSGSPDEDAVRTFVNSRRAVGNEAPIDATVTGDALIAELREQRARDLFLGGYRLGDLRRYLRQPGADGQHAFPTGDHPVVEWGQYETTDNTAVSSTCFPLPLEEYQGNKNITDPNSNG